MRTKRTIVAWVLIALLVATFAAPERSEALSSGEIAAIVVGSVVGWFTLVFVGAALVYRKPTPEKNELVQADVPAVAPTPERRIRFGPECPPLGDPVTGVRPTFCW